MGVRYVSPISDKSPCFDVIVTASLTRSLIGLVQNVLEITGSEDVVLKQSSWSILPAFLLFVRDCPIAVAMPAAVGSADIFRERSESLDLTSAVAADHTEALSLELLFFS